MERESQSITAELEAVAELAAKSLREFEAHEHEWNEQIEAIRHAELAASGWSVGLEEYLATKPDLREVAERLDAELAPIDTALAELETECQRWLNEATAIRERWRRWLAETKNAAG